MKAVASPDGATVTLSGRAWSETFDVGRLPERIDFYRSLATRPKSGRFYIPTLHALEAARDQLRKENS